MSQSAMGLPAAGRAHARDERSDRTDVFKLIGIGIVILKAIQVLFEREAASPIAYGSSSSSSEWLFI